MSVHLGKVTAVNNDFGRQVDRWLQSVAEGCDRIATCPLYEMDLDFYAFQSDVYFQPKAMFIGANPGGKKRYSEMKTERGWDKRPPESLKSDRNMFLAYDGWKFMRSLCELFSGDVLRPVFEQAVMTNIFYFNTPTFRELQKRMNRGGKEALAFCVEKSVELICDIICPEHIILMGRPPVTALQRYFDTPLVPLVVTPAEGWQLIGTTTLSGIPVYAIHHPSMNWKFNSGENQMLKKEKFEEIFKS